MHIHAAYSHHRQIICTSYAQHMNIYIPMHAFHPWVTLQRGSECICMYLIVSAVAALLQRCCRAVAALLQRCCSAVAPMLHQCCNAVASLWMAHKMLPPHLSSMRKITFKLLFSKKSSAAPKIYLEMMMIGWDLGRGGGLEWMVQVCIWSKSHCGSPQQGATGKGTSGQALWPTPN